jgi:MFS family permease
MFKDDGFRKARIATLVAFLLNGITVGSFVSRIPDIKHSLGITNSLLGASLFFGSAGVLAALRPASKAAARFGSGPQTKWANFAMILGFPLISLLFSVQWLWVSIFISGFLNSVQDLTMNAHASTLEHKAGKRVMSTFHAAWSVGGFLGGALGALAIGLGASIRLHAALLALFVLIVSFLVRNWYLPAEADQHETAPEHKKNKRPRKFYYLGLLGLCGAIGEGAASDWGGILARNFGASHLVATLPFVIFSTTMVIGRLSGDAIAHKFGTIRLLTWSGLIAGSGLFIGLMIGNVWGVLLAWFLLGIGVATVIPMMISASGELANNKYSGQVSAAEGVAMVTGIAYFGFVVGPPVLGFIADQIGLRWAMMIPAGLAIIVSLGSKKVLTS